MKILHINGTNHGGGARVAERIHNSLISKGIESYIYLPFKKDLKNIISPKTTFGEIFNTIKPPIIRKVNKILGSPSKETLSVSIFSSFVLFFPFFLYLLFLSLLAYLHLVLFNHSFIL